MDSLIAQYVEAGREIIRADAELLIERKQKEAEENRRKQEEFLSKCKDIIAKHLPGELLDYASVDPSKGDYQGAVNVELLLPGCHPIYFTINLHKDIPARFVMGEGTPVLTDYEGEMYVNHEVNDRVNTSYLPYAIAHAYDRKQAEDRLQAEAKAENKRRAELDKQAAQDRQQEAVEPEETPERKFVEALKELIREAWHI